MKVLLTKITSRIPASLQTRITRSTTIQGSKIKPTSLKEVVNPAADTTVYCQVPTCGASVPKLYEKHSGTCVVPSHKSCMIKRGDAS